METKLNLKVFISALVLALALLFTYEWYWRNVEVWHAGYDSNNEIWAHWRGKIDDLTADDIVIIGSSRAHFNFNIHLFDSLTSKRPIMLAIAGGSPFYTLEDIVNNSSFNGLLIIGVAPGLFFTLGTSDGAMWVKNERVDFYKKQTYASKFSQEMYGYIDPHFNYLDPDISLRHLIDRIPLPNRDSVEGNIIWPPMVSMDQYRNVRMNPEMEVDTTLQNWQTKIWRGDGIWKNPHADSVAAILNHYSSLAKAFTKKGGRVVFVQSPVTGDYLENEPVLYPREKYWDALLEQANAKGYHYEDYPELKAMRPPEWSHLNRKESDIFTKKIVSLLKQDGFLGD